MTTPRRSALAVLLAIAPGLLPVACTKREAGPSGGPAVSRAKPGRRGGHRLLELIPLPPGSLPHGIVVGPDGHLWFTLANRRALGTLAPGDPTAVTEVPLPVSSPRPEEIASGPDGALWCTAAAGTRIVRVAAAAPHESQEFKRLGSFRNLYGIAAGRDGTLWLGGEFRLIRMRATVPPEYEEYPYRYNGGTPSAVALDAAGNVWFTRGNGMLGRASPQSPLDPEAFELPDPKCWPQGIAVSQDDAVWFTERIGNAVARFGPARHTLLEFALPTPNAQPRAIVRGPDDALWFTEPGAGKVGRIGAREPFAVAEFAVPAAGSRPWAVASGPDGNVWFTDAGANAVGRIDLAAARDEIRSSEERAGTAGSRVTTTVVEASGVAGPKDGTLAVRADADCTFSLDGKELFKSATGHSRTLTLAPGWHVVSAVAAWNGKRITQAVQVIAGRTAFVSFEGLAPPPEPTKTPPRRPW
jgi:virginiamycin B lyase